MRTTALSRSEKYVLLDVHYQAVLAESFGLSVETEQFQEIYHYIIEHLAPELTGVIIDTDDGLDTWLEQSMGQKKPSSSNPPGLALPLHQPFDAMTNPTMLPVLSQQFSSHHVSQNYAVGYVVLPYHPAEQAALQKKHFLAELHDSCQHQGIDLMVSLVVYTPADTEFSVDQFQSDQLEAIQELQGWAEALILQYPQDPLACATLTAELDIPWLVSAPGIAYDQFKDMVRDSLEAGAAGVVLDGSIWQEATQLRQEDHSPDIKEIKQLLLTNVRDRLIELTRIVTAKN